MNIGKLGYTTSYNFKKNKTTKSETQESFNKKNNKYNKFFIDPIINTDLTNMIITIDNQDNENNDDILNNKSSSFHHSKENSKESSSQIEGTEQQNIPQLSKMKRNNSSSNLMTALKASVVIKTTLHDNSYLNKNHDLTIINKHYTPHLTKLKKQFRDNKNDYVNNTTTLEEISHCKILPSFNSTKNATELLLNYFKFFLSGIKDIFEGITPTLLSHNFVADPKDRIIKIYDFEKKHDNAIILLNLLQYLNTNFDVSKIIFKWQELLNQTHVHNN